MVDEFLREVNEGRPRKLTPEFIQRKLQILSDRILRPGKPQPLDSQQIAKPSVVGSEEFDFLNIVSEVTIHDIDQVKQASTFLSEMVGLGLMLLFTNTSDLNRLRNASTTALLAEIRKFPSSLGLGYIKMQTMSALEAHIILIPDDRCTLAEKRIYEFLAHAVG
jgi:hypothetical protein